VKLLTLLNEEKDRIMQILSIQITVIQQCIVTELKFLINETKNIAGLLLLDL
jgi:hypothetical protein